MKLVVSGLGSGEAISDSPKFKHLWGKYVLGFKPQRHCLACLQGRMATAVKPGMLDGEYELRDDLPFFYLCGVGQYNRVRDPEYLQRKHTNVHLAVRPRTGSVASTGSIYGAVFTIQDAQAIPIETLSEGFGGLTEPEHWRCKNFQFGYQIFDISEPDVKSATQVIKEFRPAYRP